MNNELQQAIVELKLEFNQKIEDLKKEFEGKKQSGMPERGQVYWCITGEGKKKKRMWTEIASDYYRLHRGNIWLDENECERYHEIDKKYKKLVWELNQKKPIDWENGNQRKYYCYWCYTDEKSDQSYVSHIKGQHIYCTEEKIHDMAKDLIGRADFEWYLQKI